MASEPQFEHHGLSGEYVMLPSGQMVPAEEAVKPAAKPAKAETAEPVAKAKG
jgi:hypothetical protein